jgi:hypothetical protein
MSDAVLAAVSDAANAATAAVKAAVKSGNMQKEAQLEWEAQDHQLVMGEMLQRVQAQERLVAAKTMLKKEARARRKEAKQLRRQRRRDLEMAERMRTQQLAQADLARREQMAMYQQSTGNLMLMMAMMRPDNVNGELMSALVAK